MTESESKVNVFLEKLQKKFNEMKLKEQEEKAQEENLAMSQRFEITTRNFENTVYNSTLYNIREAIKEMPLTASYNVSSDVEEFIYSEYFRAKYPYSSVTSNPGGGFKQVKIILLDEDREKFLYKYGFKVEERQIPETYFVPFK